METANKERLPICVDFDGTLVTHHYPNIGEENKPCVEVLKKWIKGGVGVILDSMRSGEDLDNAVKWCKDRGIELYGIGEDPHQHEWGASTHKAYGVLSVDDRNLGVPLKQKKGERPMVDWNKIDELYSDAILKMAERYL